MSLAVYTIITDRICKLLEAGTVPWRKPWTVGANGEGVPRNAISGKPYRGINIWTLTGACFADPRWITFKQAAGLGGSVRKGEHGFPVIFWKIGDGVDEETGKARKTFILRYYTVFNVAQCEGLNLPAVQGPALPANPVQVIAAAETICNDYLQESGINFAHGGDRAYYAPSLDAIRMPAREAFKTAEEYYSTLFHEMGHSTGHESRLAREGIVKCEGFGSHSYSKEELVAEFCASYLCAVVGIESVTIDNSAAYIASWLRKLKDNPKWLVNAASAAQKAADLIHGAPGLLDEEEEESAPVAAEPVAV